MNDIDNLDDYLINYFNKWKNSRYSNIGTCEFIIKLFHLLVVLYILFGVLLPYKLTIPYILCLIMLLISWKLFDGCLLTLLFNKTYFIPLSKGRAEQIICVLLIIACFNYTYPSYSLFNIIYGIMEYLNNNWNKY